MGIFSLIVLLIYIALCLVNVGIALNESERPSLVVNLVEAVLFGFVAHYIYGTL